MEQNLSRLEDKINNLKETKSKTMTAKKDTADLTTTTEAYQQKIAQNVTSNAKLLKVLQNRIVEVAKEARNRPCKLVEGLNNRLESLENSDKLDSKFISELIDTLSTCTSPQRSFTDFKQIIRLNFIPNMLKLF